MARRKRQTGYAEGRGRAPWWLRWPAAILWRLRWQLMPYSVTGLAVLVGWVAWLLARLGWEWLAGLYGVLAVIAAAWIFGAPVRQRPADGPAESEGLTDPYERGLALVTVLAGGGLSAAIVAHPGRWEIYLSAPFVASVLGVFWWWGGPGRRAARFAARAARFAASPAGEGGARLIGAYRVKAGEALRVRRGRGQTWEDVRKEVAENEDVPVATVSAVADQGGNRSGTVRIVTADMFSIGREVPHPALLAGAGTDGWAPGARTILDPIPLGEQGDGTPEAIPLLTADGAARILVVGKSGGGKSNTVGNIVAGVAATVDGLVFGSDVVKGGSTLLPWLAALAEPPALTEQAAIDQMDRVLAEIDRRGRIVAESDSDVWEPTADAPAWVYVIVEAAGLFGRFPDLADKATDIVRLGRQVGVAAIVESQGTDWDSIPTQLRENLSGVIAHKMSAAALGRVWPAARGVIDMELFERPGMAYVKWDGGVGDAEGMLPIRTYAVYQPRDRRALAGRYARDGRPAPAEAVPTPAHAPAAVGPDWRARAVETHREAADLVDNPPSMRPGPMRDMADDEPFETTDAERDAAFDALRELLGEMGAEAVRSFDLAKRLRVSRATALRRLADLRAEGRVETVGSGAATVWRPAPADVAG